MKSQIIAGFFLMIIWISVLLLMGSDIKPNGIDNEKYSPCYQNGHPLWTDC